MLLLGDHMEPREEKGETCSVMLGSTVSTYFDLSLPARVTFSWFRHLVSYDMMCRGSDSADSDYRQPWRWAPSLSAFGNLYTAWPWCTRANAGGLVAHLMSDVRRLRVCVSASEHRLPRRDRLGGGLARLSNLCRSLAHWPLAVMMRCWSGKADRRKCNFNPMGLIHVVLPADSKIGRYGRAGQLEQELPRAAILAPSKEPAPCSVGGASEAEGGCSRQGPMKDACRWSTTR
jgi:hypothetical protein